jgi:hypothetical protein
MMRTALILAESGLHVFPCRPLDKRPATLGGLKSATTDPDIIKAWWTEAPDCNLAVATGAVSKMFVLDVDGLAGERELRNLEATYGALPPTVETVTPRAGRHCFFNMPAADIRNSAGKVAPHIDVRGNGGYVILPPSLGQNGRRYTWSVDCADTLADAPGWLLARITERTNGNSKVAPTPSSEWRALLAEGVSEGQRDCSAARLAGYLLRRYIDPFVVLEILRMWNDAKCRPPLCDGDIERVVNSIAAKELKRRGAA